VKKFLLGKSRSTLSNIHTRNPSTWVYDSWNCRKLFWQISLPILSLPPLPVPLKTFETLPKKPEKDENHLSQMEILIFLQLVLVSG
jgi:hypothetical protein